MKTPREVIEEWVTAFNYRDALRAAALYHEDATNWQVAVGEPVVGRARINEDLTSFFRAFPDNFTRIVNLFEDGEWAILEWFGGSTWKGEIAGMPPNGKAFALRESAIFSMLSMARSNISGVTGIELPVLTVGNSGVEYIPKLELVPELRGMSCLNQPAC